MEIGLLTARMRDKPLAEIIQWAADAGFDALEVTSAHLGLEPSADDKKVKSLLEKTGLHFSSIAHYDGQCLTDPERSSRELMKAVGRAVEFGTDVVCAIAGLPLDGKTKEESIDERFRAVFAPAVEEAQTRGARIAIENWYATVFQNFALWDRAFDIIDSPVFGLNYDPSHLHWQQLDYVEGVHTYAKRIFHVHAKDVTISRGLLAQVGVLGKGWWRYSIPGQGEIDWGRFVGALRSEGYDGVMSVEHEDRTFGAEAGFELALRCLKNFVH